MFFNNDKISLFNSVSINYFYLFIHSFFFFIYLCYGYLVKIPEISDTVIDLGYF